MYSKLYRGLSFKFFPFYLKIFAHVKVEFTPHQKVNVCLNYMFYLMWRRQSYRFLATKRDHFLFVWFFFGRAPYNILLLLLCYGNLTTRTNIFARNLFNMGEHLDILNDNVAKTSGKPVFEMATGYVEY